MKLYGETFPNQGGIKKFEFLRKLPVTKAERHFRPKIWNLKQQDHPEKETTTNHRQRLISSKAKQIRWQMVFSTYCLLFLRSIYIFSTSTVSTSSRWLEISFQNEVFGADAYNCDVNNENCALAYQGMFLDLLPNQQQSPPGFLHVSQVFQRSVCSQSTTGSPEDPAAKSTHCRWPCHCAEHREFAFRAHLNGIAAGEKLYLLPSINVTVQRNGDATMNFSVSSLEQLDAILLVLAPAQNVFMADGARNVVPWVMLRTMAEPCRLLQEMLTAYKVNFHPSINPLIW